MGNNQLKVWVVGRNAAIRAGLRDLCLRRGWRVEAYARAAEMPFRRNAARADAIVADLTFGAIGRRELAALARAQGASCEILGYEAARRTVRMARLDAGPPAPSPLTRAIVQAVGATLKRARRRHAASPRTRGAANEAVASSTLTARERDVFRLLAQGLPNGQIARELGVSVKTIETHKEHLKAKLRLTSTADLMAVAVRSMRKRNAA